MVGLTGISRVPGHPFTGKIQHYIDRLQQARLEVLDDTSRKRGLPAEPVDGLDNAKRARLDAQTPPLLKIPPLPSGPISYAQLYTLTEDVGLSSFDVKQLPSDLVVKIAVPILARIDASLFNQAIGVSLGSKTAPVHPASSVLMTPIAGCSRPLSDFKQATSRRSATATATATPSRGGR